MSDLTTSYLGLRLNNPLVCSSSPLCQDLDEIRRMEDHGAAAIVLHSLFEEQIEIESHDLDIALDMGAESYAESLRYFPEMGGYNRGPEGYLEHIRKAKERTSIPIIASLNGVSLGGWVRYARLMQDAGADALELNVYHIPTRADEIGSTVEANVIEVVRAIREQLSIPLAVKLSPFYSSPAAFARQLAEAGANGLVLFNRFYQPDFDLETLEVVPALHLSNPYELLLRLHWVAILYGQVDADLAITGGVHQADGVLKAMMAGAKVAMLTSAVLSRGAEHLQTILENLVRWMESHEYESIVQMQGSMSLKSVANPAMYERGNYMKVLRSYALKSRT